MNSEILDPDIPLTRADARMFERLARDKSWMGGITQEMRGKIVSKLLAGYAHLKVNEGMSQEDLRLNMSILDRVARTFGLLDQIDQSREAAALKESQGPGGDRHLHLNAPAEMFRELMNEVRTHQHPAEADSEPAGDD